MTTRKKNRKRAVKAAYPGHKARKLLYTRNFKPREFQARFLPQPGGGKEKTVYPRKQCEGGENEHACVAFALWYSVFILYLFFILESKKPRAASVLLRSRGRCGRLPLICISRLRCRRSRNHLYSPPRWPWTAGETRSLAGCVFNALNRLV